MFCLPLSSHEGEGRGDLSKDFHGTQIQSLSSSEWKPWGWISESGGVAFLFKAHLLHSCWRHTWASTRIICVCVYAESQSCPTLCNSMDYSPPGSSFHGISQARIQEWVAVSFSRGSSQPRDGTCISCIGRQVGYTWATWEAPNRIYAHWKLDRAWPQKYALSFTPYFMLIILFFHPFFNHSKKKRIY